MDSEELNDWLVEFEIDLEVSRETEQVALRLKRIGPLLV